MRRLGLSIVAALLLGCATEPTQDQPLPVDSRYPVWYQETEACSSLAGRYDRLAFWVLDEGSPNAGETWGRDVYIKWRYATSAFVVKHEMLHTLLRGDAHHLNRAWQDCGLAHP